MLLYTDIYSYIYVKNVFSTSLTYCIMLFIFIFKILIMRLNCMLLDRTFKYASGFVRATRPCAARTRLLRLINTQNRALYAPLPTHGSFATILTLMMKRRSQSFLHPLFVKEWQSATHGESQWGFSYVNHIDVTSRCHWLMSWRKWLFLGKMLLLGGISCSNVLITMEGDDLIGHQSQPLDMKQTHPLQIWAPSRPIS